MTPSLLTVRDVQVFYGTSQALFGVSMDVSPGECVTLMGRNGVGRSTLVQAIMGMLPLRAGTMALRGRALHGLASHQIGQLGIGLVPEGRRIFAHLTVRENLLATQRHRTATGKAAAWTLEQVYELFPRLRERERHLGPHLSGGEQQMLAIGRALLTQPELLILDEATEGLSPRVRQDIWACLRHLKSTGMAMIVIDKNMDALMRLGDRHFVLGKGRMVWSGDSHALRNAADIQQTHIGL